MLYYYSIVYVNNKRSYKNNKYNTYVFSFVVGIIIRLANSSSLIGAWFILLQLL